MRQNTRARRVPCADQTDPGPGPRIQWSSELPGTWSKRRRTCEAGKRGSDDGVGKDEHDGRCRSSIESCAGGHRSQRTRSGGPHSDRRGRVFIGNVNLKSTACASQTHRSLLSFGYELVVDAFRLFQKGAQDVSARHAPRREAASRRCGSEKPHRQDP
jgi:hypothetical protein